MGAFPGYARSEGYTLPDSRLNLPEQRLGAEDARRCQRCGIPEALSFPTRQELGDAGGVASQSQRSKRSVSAGCAG